MEEFKSSYRDELAAKLNKIRKNPDKKPELARAEAVGYLKAKQETPEYQELRERKKEHSIYQEETEQREKELDYIRKNPGEIIKKYDYKSIEVLNLLDRCKEMGIPVSLKETFGGLEFTPMISTVEEYIKGLGINPEHYNLTTGYGRSLSGYHRDTEKTTLQDMIPGYPRPDIYPIPKVVSSLNYDQWKRTYPYASKDIYDVERLTYLIIRSYLGFSDKDRGVMKRRRETFVEQFKKTDKEIAKIEEEKEKERQDKEKAKQNLIRKKEEELKKLKGET